MPKAQDNDRIGPPRLAIVDDADGSSVTAPTSLVEAIKAPKAPPVETTQALWTRRSILLSFWFIALCMGLPLWWKTTTVYRAKLPLESMSQWADGKLCNPVFPLRIALEAPSLSPVEAQNLLQITQHSLDDLSDFSAHHLRLFLSETARNDNNDGTEGQTTALTVRLRLSGDAANPTAILNPHASDLDVAYSSSMISSSSSSSSILGSFVASQLQEIFSEEEAILAHLLSSHSVNSGKKKPLSPDFAARLERRTTRSLKHAPTYHLTFSLFTPEANPSSWDIQEAVSSTFEPLIQALSSISNLTIDTQVQPYATLAPSIQPTFSTEQNSWTLSRAQLGGFINAAEWPLSPSIGSGPTVHFILYVPGPSLAPLTVDGSEGTNAWLIPQWGGVVIHNPATSSHHLTAADLHAPFLTFSHQLLSLLGLPEHPASLPIRLATLSRVRAASLFLSASSTLGSLARLTLALPSISIPNSVADSVSLTIAHLETSCAAFKKGDFETALHSARIAEAAAETAFFERSMVGQVYFPDEHKVAVYLPLLGPVAVPLVLAAIKELKPLVLGWVDRSRRVRL